MTQILYVEGNIGTGKTTFIQLLKKFLTFQKFTWKVVLEPVDQWMSMKDKDGNNLLEEFYKDQVKYSFPFQMNSFISRSYSIHEVLKENPDLDVLFVERSVFTDKLCFAQLLYESGKINELEYKIYNEWHSKLVSDFKLNADGYIYLRTNPQTSHFRIKRRSRPGEDIIPITYLESLHEKHENWLLNSEPKEKVLTLDVSGSIFEDEIFNEFVTRIKSHFKLP